MKKFSSILAVLLLMSVSFSAHAQGYPRGDVDRDGSVNISDVTCLIDNLLNGISEGDVDQDGAVNISDATCLIDYLLQGTWPDDPVAPPDTHEYVDLGLPSGTLWATCNVGASSPEDCGDYFAWGETEPKGYYDWSTYKWCNGNPGSFLKYYPKVDNKVELAPGDDAAYVNWGASWRMPTLEQIQELLETCTGQSTTQNGVNGLLVTGPNGKTMFLPATGYRFCGSLIYSSLDGFFWSRTLSSSDPSCAYSMVFSIGTGDGIRENHYYRYEGFPVRAVLVL